MTNRDYVELIEFDRDKLSYSTHKKLRLYIDAKGKYHLSYYLAKLSHDIYPARTMRGHVIRQGIRDDLRTYANMYFASRINNKRMGRIKTMTMRHLTPSDPMYVANKVEEWSDRTGIADGSGLTCITRLVLVIPLLVVSIVFWSIRKIIKKVHNDKIYC